MVCSGISRLSGLVGHTAEKAEEQKTKKQLSSLANENHEVTNKDLRFYTLCT